MIVAVLGGRLRLTVEGQDTNRVAGEVLHTRGEGRFSSLALEDDTKVLVTLLKFRRAEFHATGRHAVTVNSAGAWVAVVPQCPVPPFWGRLAVIDGRLGMAVD